MDEPAAPQEALERAAALVHLPFKLGGLGLRSAVRVAQAAYWASWADSLPMIHRRHPAIAAYIQQSLDLPADTEALADCLQEARAARLVLLREGFSSSWPTGAQVVAGARPRQPEAAEPGEWAHGWQFWAASARDAHAREELFASQSGDPAFCALVRSQSGRGGGRVFTVLPTSPATALSSAELRMLLLRRLRLPLPLWQPGAAAVDAIWTSRVTTGQLAPLAASCVCGPSHWRRLSGHEAGARVAEDVLLQNVSLQGVSARDSRQIEVVANGLPLWHGAQLAVDATLVSPIRRDGRPQPRAAQEDEAQLLVARRRKEAKYAELLRSRRCRLVVLGIEVGGRWSDEALDFVRLLAKSKARASPAILRRSAQAAWANRWTGLLAVAASRALACSLLELPVDEAGCNGEAPPCEDVLHEARLAAPPMPSRMPARTG